MVNRQYVSTGSFQVYQIDEFNTCLSILTKLKEHHILIHLKVPAEQLVFKGSEDDSVNKKLDYW